MELGDRNHTISLFRDNLIKRSNNEVVSWVTEEIKRELKGVSKVATTGSSYHF